MFATHCSSGHFIRLDPGEEMLNSLTEYLRQAKIEGGVIMGIGAVKDSVLGYFHLPEKSYIKRAFSGEMELVAFNGNITWSEDQPFIHAHATLSGEDFLAYSGHLFEAVIAITGEFFLTPAALHLQRRHDEKTGLKLISNERSGFVRS